MNHFHRVLFVFCSIVLCACSSSPQSVADNITDGLNLPSSSSSSSSSSNSSSSSSSSSSSGVVKPSASPAVVQTLSLSGNDTSVIGNTVSVKHYIYRSDFVEAQSQQSLVFFLLSGGDQALIAADNALSINLFRTAAAELESDEFNAIALGEQWYFDYIASRVVLYVGPTRVTLDIEKGDDDEWRYETEDCDPAAITEQKKCPSVVFDKVNRTVTLNNVLLDDFSDMATAPITINGTIKWSVQDADPLVGPNR